MKKLLLTTLLFPFSLFATDYVTGTCTASAGDKIVLTYTSTNTKYRFDVKSTSKTEGNVCNDTVSQYISSSGSTLYCFSKANTAPSGESCNGVRSYTDIGNRVRLEECTPPAILDIETNTCKEPEPEVPECNLPENKILSVDFDNVSACNTYLNNLPPLADTSAVCTGCTDSKGNWTGGIYTDPSIENCPAGTTVQTYTTEIEGAVPIKVCVPSSECTPLSKTIVPNITKDMCSATTYNSLDGYTSPIAWNECDSTCYATEPMPIPCEEVAALFDKSCDAATNDRTFKCVDSSTLDTFPTVETTCTPKPTDTNISDDNTTDTNEENTTDTTSDSDFNDKILNTLDLSQETLSSIDEKLSSNNKMIEEFKDTNEKQLDDVNNNLKDIGEKQDKTNQLLSNSNSKLDNIIGNTAQTNTNLGTISNQLSALSQEVDVSSASDLDSLITDSDNFIKQVTDQYKDFSKNIDSQVNQIKEAYNSAKSLFEGGFNFEPLKSNGDDTSCFTANVFGKEIKLQLCPYLKILSPIIYFMMMIYFMVESIKISMSYILRGD